ncbi:cytochrome c oxidase assembly protein [Micromonospora endolithica]|uniref:Copper resistance protein CopD n=1 Tax=Micromonospora endolithica TaxID=230091 RepID=A0A3A9ZS01_9ACTN|nr:cytochrome c oxidase assembly protein [Micromonospora endolithica]RKN50366.1 copper resistance protein CopD [Micromonospora endolithica]TWJ20963.1 putative copper resistance protein D [Micromonospora endolithica]
MNLEVIRRRPVLVPAATVLVAAGVGAALLWWGGAAVPQTVPGLPDPGPATAWLLPTARLGMRVGAVATVGLLLAVVLLSPRSDEGGLSALGYRRLRAAAWSAGVWAASTGVAVCYTLVDLFGLPASQVLSARAVLNFALTIPLGQALTLGGAFALLAAVVAAMSLRPAGATVALLAALAGVVPPVFTGHAAAADNHQLAVSGLLLHVLPATVWAGGLFALAVTRRGSTADLTRAVRRFSPLALACLVAVAASGLLSTAVRLTTPADLVGTRYGQLALVKMAALGAVAVAGLLHRRWAIGALAGGDRRPFLRVAVVETLLFAAAVGAAVALSRTPAPVGEGEEDAVTALLGFPMPPPLSVETATTAWMPEPLIIAATLAAAGLYLAGVWRLRRRGDAWPPARTALWLAGCAVIVVATSSGLARYGAVLFSVHMVQHLLLMMVAPILLVLAGPVTLGLRALPPSTDPRWPGPREWLQAALHSRVSQLVTHPVAALTLYVTSLYVLYFTGLYELAVRSHAAHLAMIVHFLGVGYLFFWVVIGIDPAPRRIPHPLKLVLVLISMVLHAFLGVALMQSTTLLAADWWTALARPWGPTPLEDQRAAGGIAWSFGELPTVVVLGALMLQWMRADQREARRRDRAADRAAAEGREDDELAAYNRMLADLAERDRQVRT